MNEKWDLRYLRLAREISTWSKDPSTKVGSVIVDSKNTIVSTGYNGLNRKSNDDIEKYNNRDIKYKLILHAERNAIIFGERQRLIGASIFVYPFLPCSMCASMIIQAEIIRVVTLKNMWSKEEFDLAINEFNDANVQVNFYDESLL